MEHWYAKRGDRKTSVETESDMLLRARVERYTRGNAESFKDTLQTIVDRKVPAQFPIHPDLRVGRIRPSATMIKELASTLESTKDRLFHVIVPPVYPVCLLVVPFGQPSEPTEFADDRVMPDAELKGAMRQFEYDLARRSVTHAILCELPRKKNVDALLRSRRDCVILNAKDAGASTLVFVLWREPQAGEPPRIDEVDEPASPLRPLSDLDPGIVWAETAEMHDAIVASDPDRYQERLLSVAALACFK